MLDRAREIIAIQIEELRNRIQTLPEGLERSQMLSALEQMEQAANKELTPQP